MKKYQNKKWLRRMFLTKGLSADEIAEMYSLSRGLIYLYLKKFGIKKETRKGRYKDKQWLKKKYIKEKISGTKIAHICKASRRTVQYYLERYGLDKEKNLLYNHTSEMIYCACGCKNLRPKFDKYGRKMKFIAGHNGKKNPINPLVKCKCGCGKEFLKYDRDGKKRKYFECWHNRIGTKASKKTKDKLSQSLIGKTAFPIKEKFFDLWTKKSAYILGLLMADGNITKPGELSLLLIDKHIIKSIKLILGAFQHKLKKIIRPERKIKYGFAIRNQHWKNRLNKLGIIPNKTGKERFPEMPKKFQRHFIRGYFDGDGSIWFNQGRRNISIECANKIFLKKIQTKLQLHGIEPTYIYKRKNKNPLYTLRITKQKIINKYFDFLYKGANLYLLRKYKKFGGV